MSRMSAGWPLPRECRGSGVIKQRRYSAEIVVGVPPGAGDLNTFTKKILEAARRLLTSGPSLTNCAKHSPLDFESALSLQTLTK